MHQNWAERTAISEIAESQLWKLLTTLVHFDVLSHMYAYLLLSGLIMYLIIYTHSSLFMVLPMVLIQVTSLGWLFKVELQRSGFQNHTPTTTHLYFKIEQLKCWVTVILKIIIFFLSDWIITNFVLIWMKSFTQTS